MLCGEGFLEWHGSTGGFQCYYDCHDTQDQLTRVAIPVQTNKSLQCSMQDRNESIGK